MAIPFKSLRFPANEQQEWGIILYRGITRKTEDSFWPHISPRLKVGWGRLRRCMGWKGFRRDTTSN